jgi:hypothetical protein
MRKLWVLVLLESVLLVLLAVQLFGATVSEATTRSADDQATAPHRAAAEQGTASGDAASSAKEARLPVQRTVATATWSKDDPVGILVTGTVKGRDGSAVKDPSVSFVQDDHWHSGDLGKLGTYAATGLQPGASEVRVAADGFADLKTAFTVTGEAVQRFDIMLDAAYPVAVRMETPDGKPLNPELNRLSLYQGLQIVGDNNPIPEHLAPTDYGIVFFGAAKWQAIQNPKDSLVGTLELPEAPPAYVAALLRSVVIAQQQIAPGQKEVKFAIDPKDVFAQTGIVKVRLLDADTGQPLTDARVSAHHSNMGGGGALVDAEGRVTIAEALPGLLILDVYAKDHETPWLTFRLGAGETKDLGDLRLGKRIEIEGRVLDADGKVVSARVAWTELKWFNDARQFVHNRSATVDGEGRFKLGVGRGAVSIMARTRDDRVAAGTFDVPSPNPIELRLAPASTCTVTRPTDPARAFTITVFVGDRAIESLTLEPRSQRMAIKLPAGSYRFEAIDDTGRIVKSGPLTLGGEPVTIDLQ